ncbi:hypothetical protein TNCV_17351 [Trichonephila clavipes]|nr:hypothetical protein TNCV_17351 [Trichonephila clavipes]
MSSSSLERCLKERVSGSSVSMLGRDEVSDWLYADSLAVNSAYTRGLLASNLVILKLGQVTRMTPKMALSPNYHITPMGGCSSTRC